MDPMALFFFWGGEGMLGVDIWISVFIGVSPLSSAPKKQFSLLVSSKSS